jgi:hypothetical protein
MPRVAVMMFAASLLARAVPGERQTGRQGAQGYGGVIIQDGKARGAAAVSPVVWFRDYATGQGYVAQGTAWQRVGTTLVVSPTILPNGQIRVRLAPQVSYFSAQGDGSIECTEAATEVIVLNGRAMRVGGATRGINQVTRQIFGYREHQSSSESIFVLTATIQ